jgi:hypothetical protein
LRTCEARASSETNKQGEEAGRKKQGEEADRKKRIARSGSQGAGDDAA